MSDQPNTKKKITRSPGYPSLSLREALEKAQLLWDKEKRHPAPLPAIESHFGFKVGAGTVFRVISALGKFGLVDDEGQGDGKQYKLSESALTILLSPTDSAERLEAIKTAAMLPALHREIWDLYGGDLPSDETLRSYLILKRSFNPGSVDDFIANFRDTLSFASILGANAEFKQAPAVDEKPDVPKLAKNTPTKNDILPKVEGKHPTPLQLQPLEGKNKMLAQYNIPLGSNQATLVFTGEELTADDFDALKDFVEFSKKQFERAQSKGMQKTLETLAAVTEKFPRDATWKNKDFDKKVIIIGLMGVAPNGTKYYSSSDGNSGIPEFELEFED